LMGSLLFFQRRKTKPCAICFEFWLVADAPLAGDVVTYMYDDGLHKTTAWRRALSKARCGGALGKERRILEQKYQVTFFCRNLYFHQLSVRFSHSDHRHINRWREYIWFKYYLTFVFALRRNRSSSKMNTYATQTDTIRINPQQLEQPPR
jgi:hypothetical protein